VADAGVVLEARVQRLFLAQGIFAERSLFPAADVAHRLIATDIDVLVSEYSSGFHLTRRHAECKSGKRVPILDRVLWLNGVRSMLGADASYLVLESFDEDATDFARSLSIDVMTVRQLDTWEKAFGIPQNQWPNRSDFGLIDPIKKRSLDTGRRKDAPDVDKIIRQSIQFVDIDSWRVFGYGRLNRLLRLLKDLSDAVEKSGSEIGVNLNARYAASAVLVRLSQYLLAVCLDISRVPVSDVQGYLVSRLMYGDQDPRRARGLVHNTVDWMSQALKDRGMSIPPEVDPGRLFQPPSYSDGLVALTQKILNAPNEARYLPVAMDTEQFSKGNEVDSFARLRSARNAGSGLAALVKGFAVASLGVDRELLAPLRCNKNPEMATVRVDQAERELVSANQSELDLGQSTEETASNAGL